MFIRNGTYEIMFHPIEDGFEVDDPIAPAISILNGKGYRTAFCCCGHADMGRSIAYIQFDFGGITPEYLPLGWYWVCDSQMEYNYENVTQTLIESVMSELTAWAASLPSAAD